MLYLAAPARWRSMPRAPGEQEDARSSSSAARVGNLKAVKGKRRSWRTLDHLARRLRKVPASAIAPRVPCSRLTSQPTVDSLLHGCDTVKVEVKPYRWAERGWSAWPLQQKCVLCGKTVTAKGGIVPRPLDRRPAGVRCAVCYRRYLRKYFPEAIA